MTVFANRDASLEIAMTRRIDSGIVSNYTVGVVEQTTILLTPPPQKKKYMRTIAGVSGDARTQLAAHK
jgi:hypothetical protein